MRRLLSDLPSNHQRVWIPGGNLGTSATIRRMQALVTHGKRDFRVRKILKDILAGCTSKDYLCYAVAIHDWVQSNVKFVFDPNGVEMIEAPWEILQSQVGDCDSICVLCATLYEQAGFPSRFVTIMADASRPDAYSHVFLEVSVPGKGWLGSDCSMPGKPFGWKPSEKHPRKEWPGSLDPVETREGDAMADLPPGTQEVHGLTPGTEYDFRLEPEVIVTSDPAALELSDLGKSNNPPSMGPLQEFFTADQAEAVLRKRGPEPAVTVKAPAPKMVAGAWLACGALALLGALLLGRKQG